MQTEIEPVIHKQIAEGRQVLNLCFEDERVAFELTIDPRNSPYNRGSFPAYDVPTIKDRNPLYNALRSKAVQLKGANGLVGVIVCDGGTRTLADRQNHRNEVSANGTADEFLQQNSSISFVLLISVREERVRWPNINPPRRKLNTQLAVSKARTVSEAPARLFDQMVENLPEPVSMPVNAALRAQDTHYGLGHHGWIYVVEQSHKNQFA